MKARLFTLLSLIAIIALLVPGGVQPVAATQSQPVARITPAPFVGARVPSVSDVYAGNDVSVQDQAHVAKALYSAPLMFVENVSQLDDDAQLQVRGGDRTMAPDAPQNEVITTTYASVTQDQGVGWMDNLYNTATSLHTTGNGLTDTLRGSRFWDTPLRSDTTAFLNDQQVVMPGPNDQVRVIVQLHGDPIAVYINRAFHTPDHLTASEANAVGDYADRLASDRRRVLAQIEQQDIEVQINREFAYLFNGLALSIEMRDWQRLEQLPQVKAIYRDYEMQTVLSDSVPLIGAPSVWAMTDDGGQPVTGEGIRVAILDTGVDYTHPDLGGGIGPTYKIITGYDFVNNDNDPMDDNGHGTHVAGIVAASGVVTGVAPGANLLAYKVCNANGSCNSSDVIAGLERAADPDGDPGTDDAAHVINLSVGGPGDPDDPGSQAVDNAVDYGIVVAVAAGNDGPTYQTLDSPGVARKAFTVASSDKSDQLASSSSRGPVPDFFDVPKPDITAPGVSITSTVPSSGQWGSPDGYRSLSGTSMATPHIAGAVALIKQLHPDWTPEMIQANLMNTAKDLGAGVYEQGVGRVRVSEAVAAPLLAVPGSLTFGLPLISDTTSARLTLVNVSTATVTATASVSTVLWADALLEPLTTTVSVTYAQLSAYNFTVSPGVTGVTTVSLNIPGDAPEGYYTGRVILHGDDYTLSVPFAFTLLSKVTVHMLDENGAEWFTTWDGSIYVCKVPELDVQRNNRSLGMQVPATFYIPSGTYNVHGVGRGNFYHHVLSSWGTQQKPLLLAATATVTQGAALDIYLNGATARHFTLDTATFDGDPLYVFKWGAGFRYQDGEKEYITGAGGGSTDIKDTDLFGLLPTSLEFYISDTPDHISFTLFSAGYGYSPRHLRFRDLNSARWYDGGAADTPGFYLAQNADIVHLFGWRYPRIDASTPTTLTYSREEVSRYRVKYDFPGTMDDPRLFGSFASGGDALFYLPFSSDSIIRSVSGGWERDIYVKEAFAYLYWADDVSNQRRTDREFYTRDWAKAYTYTGDANIQLVDGWDLQPLPREEVTLTLGMGPLYPAVTFDNVTSTIQLVHPVFGSGRGNKARWGSSPFLAVYRDGAHVYSGNLSKFWWTPSPRRQIPVSSAGNYRLFITSDPDGQISYNNTIEAGFTLPGTDMNPPRVTGLEMPQRFAPDHPITVTLTVTDAESSVSSVEMCYSTNESAGWTPLSLAQEGTHYTTTINPGSALTVSLAFTATDIVGNYLAFTTLGAAIRETPVTLTMEISPVIIPLSSDPFTMTLSGTLREGDDEPLSEAALPIAIYLNDQKAGYVRDVAHLPDGTFEYGTIGFDWTFIPTDFVSSTETALLKFVFDMGTYARQEKVFTVTNTAPRLTDLPNLIFDHTSSPTSTIDLWAYAWDEHSSASALTYTIEGAPPAGVGVTLENNRYVTMDPSASWCGYTDVTIRATDPGGLWDTDTFRVAVTWSCQGPLPVPGQAAARDEPIILDLTPYEPQMGDGTGMYWYVTGEDHCTVSGE